MQQMENRYGTHTYVCMHACMHAIIRTFIPILTNRKHVEKATKTTNTMASIKIINCKSKLDNIIHISKRKLDENDIILIYNTPDLKIKHIKQLLINLKKNFILRPTYTDSKRTSSIILTNKKGNYMKDNSMILLSTPCNNYTMLIDTKLHTNMDNCIKKLNSLNTRHTTLIGLTKHIQGEQIDLESLKTRVNMSSLEQKQKDIEQLKRGYTLVRKLNEIGFINQLHDNDQKESTEDDDEEKIVCFSNSDDDNLTQIYNSGEERLIQINKTDKNRTNKKESIQIQRKIKYLKKEQFADFILENHTLCQGWQSRNVNQIEYTMNELTNNLYRKLHELQISTTTTIRVRTPYDDNNNQYNNNTTQIIHKLREIEQLIESHDKDNNNNNTLNKLKKQKDKLQVQAIKEINKKLLNDKFKNETNSNIWDRAKYADTIIEGIDTESALPLINDKEQLERLMETKFPLRVRQQQSYIEELTRKILSSDNKQEPMLISDQEIERAHYEMRKKTYTGVEGIQFRIFNMSYTHIKHIIHTICQMSFRICLTPKSCRTTLGNLIPKKAAKQFRIVHVSTPMASLLEQIALHRLEYSLELNRLYNPRQYGFTAQRDRHDLIIRLLTMITEHRNSNNKEGLCTLIGLDINGAFDNVDQDIIIQRLMDKLRPTTLNIWLANFILYRYIIVRYNALESNKQQIYMGVPQGSALGPILWNFTINELDHDLRKHNRLELLAYADDLILIHKSSIPEHNITQFTLDKLTNKLNNIKLNIRAEKCNSMIIHNNNSSSTEMQQANNTTTTTFHVNGDPIVNTNSINILGVHITNKCKLDCNDKGYIERLTESITKLRLYKEIGVTRDILDWKILIDSLIRSRTIINNYPVLALDKEACIWVENTTTDAYIQILKWTKDKRTTNAIKYLTKNYATHKLTKYDIIEKSTQEKSIELKRLVKMIMTNNNSSSNGSINNNNNENDHNDHDDDHDLGEAINEYTRNMKRDDTFYLLEKDDGYIKRRYPNPSKILKIQESKLSIEEITRHKVCWTNANNKDGCLMIKYAGNRIIYKLNMIHANYKIDYFNELAALWNISANDFDDRDRTLIMSENDALILALQNTQNHDWRIIELRERLFINKWKIITVKSRQDINRYHTKLKDNPQNIKARTIYKISEHPNIKDYVERYKLKQICRSERQTINNKMSPHILTALNETISIESWQQINFEDINDENLLTISGYIKAHPHTGWYKDEPERNKRTTWIDCECNKTNSIYQYTLLHRLFECRLYNTIRRELNTKLDKLNRDHRATERQLKSNPIMNHHQLKRIERLQYEHNTKVANEYLITITKVAKCLTG